MGDGFFIFLGLLLLALPIGLILSVIVLFVKLGNLRAAHEKLARDFGAAEAAFRAAQAGGAPPRPAAAPEEEEAPAPAETRPAAEAAEPQARALAGPEPEAPRAAWPSPPKTARPAGDAPAAPHAASGEDWGSRAARWIGANWFYAVSAVSLGLAGIFLVQYSIENQLLSPEARILLALLFGAALIGAGEAIRRRWGDEPSQATAYLPSTFSAAGLVVLYAAIIAARNLYGVIGPEMAFAGLVGVSALAVIFGWFYGPFLAASGLIGASTAPLFVSSGSQDVDPLFPYYALLGSVGLAVDAVRRWGWVSALALVLSFLWGTFLVGQGGSFLPFALMAIWLALASAAIPRLELWPTHPAPAPLEAALSGGKARPVPPVWIATGAMIAAALLLATVSAPRGPSEVLFAAMALGGLVPLLALWTHRAPGLSDLALIPALGFLAILLHEGAGFGWLYSEFRAFDAALAPETQPPVTVTLLLLLASVGSAMAAWRSAAGPFAAPWAAGAALFGPVAALIFELFWTPAQILGAPYWAAHVMGLAALMTLFALRFAKADGAPGRRTAYAILSALSLIALALFVMLAEAALTVALAVLIAAAAALDRRFRLPEMGWFLLAGIAVLGWRLVIDPGLPDYIEDAPLGEVFLAYGAALAGLAAAMIALPGERADGRAVLESALWAYGGVFATVLVWRLILALAPEGYFAALNHWAAALVGLTWLSLALAQLYRLAHGGIRLRWLRRMLAGGYGVFAALAFLAGLVPLNPFFEGGPVGGAQPFDTLVIAYGLPGLAFAALAAKAGWLPRRGLFAWPAALFLAVFAALEIRFFWQGPRIAMGDVSQPELYTYTVALLLAGGGLLYAAFARQSAWLRRLAMGVIALAVAKVFLIDAAGLSGLLRVFSFLALGLVLAGLAWLNRWVAERQEAGARPPG